MILEAIVRRFTELVSGKPAVDLRATFLESVAVGQVEPPRFELSRAGRRFNLGYSAAVTGIAPVQVLPTTAPQWAIWNPETKYAYAFEELGVYLTAGTPGVGGTLWYCLFDTPGLTGNSNGGVGVTPASRTGGGSKMIVKSGVTITTPAAPTWYPLASNASPNVTAFASSTFLEHRGINGGIIVPPQSGLGLAVVAPAGTTPLFAPFGTHVEVATDLE